jgi:ADP-heptose:LPS heptosyltransferase
MSYFQESLPQKIAILRPLQFGDLMCSIPAFRALRTAFPEADISLIGLPWSVSFVKRFNHYLDHFVEFPGFPGFPEQSPRIDAFPVFLITAQKEQYDLALQMQGSGSLSNSIISLLGAKNTAGYYLEGLYCPDPSTYMLYPVGEHEIWRHLRLMEYLDIKPQGDDLEFPLFDEDWRAFVSLQKEFNLSSSHYIVIHPGARDPRRRWSPEKFAAVADILAEYGFQIVITGTPDECDLVDEVIFHTFAPILNLSGQTTYGTLAALLSKSRLVISNDTGISHLTAALQVPSVILFTTSDAERWAPLNQKLHRRILWASAAPPIAAIREVEKLLQEEREYES